jgi:hypothetical protein
MIPSGPASDFSRVVFAVGAAMPGHAAVQTAVDLAAAVGAALEGLFVESADLLRVSALPDARETSALTGTRRQMASGDVERAFRLEAARLERLLATQAARTNIAWSFTITRGELTHQALARDAELIVVEAPGRRAGAARLSPRRGPLLSVFDATPAAQRGLAAAIRLARRTGSELVILVPAGNGAAGRSARREAEEWLRTEAIAGIALPGPLDRGGVLAVARARRCALVVLPVPLVAGWSVDIALLADAAPCPLVLAR